MLTAYPSERGFTYSYHRYFTTTLLLYISYCVLYCVLILLDGGLAEDKLVPWTLDCAAETSPDELGDFSL